MKDLVYLDREIGVENNKQGHMGRFKKRIQKETKIDYMESDISIDYKDLKTFQPLPPKDHSLEEDLKEMRKAIQQIVAKNGLLNTAKQLTQVGKNF